MTVQLVREREDVLDFLWLLFGDALEGFVEVRQLGGGRPPRQEFHDLVDLERAGACILELGRERDTYVGVAPRCHRSGKKDAVKDVYAIWVDLDEPGPVDRLAEFEPAASMVVWSGSGGAHAYWRLRSPVPPKIAEQANRRLAHHLGADMASTDAARVLRPAGTLNFKHDPPARVALDRWRGGTYTLDQAAGRLPDPPDRRTRRVPYERPTAGERATSTERHGDALLTIEPAVYFRALAGVDVGRDGKVRCPLPGHDDDEPSCHVYDDPARGHYCYGCGRGGTIYDLARELSGLGDRGADFHELRDWIARRLPHAPLRSTA